MIVNCNKCKKDFKIEIQTKTKNKLEILYFTCKHCDKEYIYLIKDDYIRDKQSDLLILKNKIDKCDNINKTNKLIKLQDKLLRDMKKYSDKLIKKYNKKECDKDN